MSRRREANRAEAIIRRSGAIIMLLLLWVMAIAAPGFLRGKSVADAVAALFTALTFFVGLLGVITILGLVVWFKVLKGPRERTTITSSSQRPSPASPAASVLTCADCGAPITSGIANYCHNRPSTFGGKSLCMPCQVRYR